MAIDDTLPLLETRAIGKAYNGIAVLKSINFSLQAGQVHALMGGNGAGKSTLMKIIAGLQTPDSGEIHLSGRKFRRLKPHDAHEQGIYMVAQEPMLFGDLSVRENILFRLPVSRDLPGKLQEKLHQLDCKLNLQASASTLEMADQQMVEILRGLMRNARVLILDEPTSSLTPGETAHLFRQIRALQKMGTGIIFISHKLPEIRALADQVSVMRDGEIVLCAPLSQKDDSDLINAMTPNRRTHTLNETQKLWLALPGQPRHQRQQQYDQQHDQQQHDQQPREACARQAPVLEVDNLTGEGFSHINLTIQAGEIVGLAGLVGAGRTELAETLYGLRAAFGGEIRLQNHPVTRYSVKQRLRQGLVYLPEDRQTAGLFVDASISWNTLVLNDHHFWQHPGREAAIAERYRRALNIKFHKPQQPVRTLSGGNQQKILLARCLQAHPRLLIVDEPTRGVDVAARADIYQLLKSIAAQQVAILMISSDVDEFPGLADRVLVMYQGHLTGELCRENIGVDRMMALAFGGHGNENIVT